MLALPAGLDVVLAEQVGSWLGVQVFGMVFFSFFERLSTGDREQRVPTSAFAQLTLCLLGTSYLRYVCMSHAVVDPRMQ